MAKADVVITPDLQDYSAADFMRKDSIIAIGYRAGQKAADSIIALVIAREKNIYYWIAAVEVESTDSALVEGCRNSLIGQSFNRAELIGRLKWLARQYGLFELTAINEPAMLAEGFFECGGPGVPDPHPAVPQSGGSQHLD